MSAWWDESRELLLITPEEFDALDDGTELLCIDGTSVVKGTDYVDMDTRFGHIAYGVTGDHPLRLQHLRLFSSRPSDEQLPEKVVVSVPQTVWECKIGVLGDLNLPAGADGPMRKAIQRAFFDITGVHAEFIFSGWAGSLDPVELEVVKEFQHG